MPRWSIAGLAAASAASIAGLPGSSAWVCVGPPLSASGPIPASPPSWSLASGLQLASWTKLCPPETTLPVVPEANFSQAYQWLPAMIVLVRVSVGTKPPPNWPMKIADGAQSGPMLLAMVELVMVMLPSVWKIAPPCQPVAVLPLIVLLVIVTLPSERIPPPTSLEVLPLIVLRTIVVVVLKKEEMPPPDQRALLPDTVLSLRLSVARW